jgi:hypothetical protein
MLIDWFIGKSKSAPGRSSGRRPSVRLHLEALEERWMPAAIRNLPGFTTNNIPANDDGSSPLVNVGFTLNFFGVQTNQLYVNNNGNLTFGQPFPTYTPTALNTDNGGIPIIAAFFADVDTSAVPAGGSQLVAYGQDNLCGRPAFGADFINVGYFDANTDKLNSFQIILVDRSDTGAGNFDIEFNYDTITWETGDVSGGTNGLGGQSAHVGYTNGTGAPGTFFELPGSGVPGSFINGGPDALTGLSVLSNTPGRQHYLVRGGQVVVAPTPGGNNDVTSGTRVLDPYRYITQMTSGLQVGDLTLVNIGVPTSVTSSAVDACLGIPAQTTTSGGVTGTSFNGPITVEFFLPSNLILISPTGTTASGRPYVTIPVSSLPQNNPALRVQVQLVNPAFNAPSTFFTDAIPVRVFAGPFDPTKA